MIKNIIFDLDNTLINSDLAYSEALQFIGLTGFNLTLFEQARQNVKLVLNKEKLNPSARNRLLYFKEYLFLNKSSFSAPEILALRDRYEEKMLQILVKQWKDLGRDSLFTELKQKAKLFILTNENLNTQLKKIAVLDPSGQYFEALLTSDEYGSEKPDLDLFRHLLKVYQLSPKETLMVGDDIFCDMNPAHALGLQTMLTLEFTKVKNASSHKAITDLNKLLEFIT